MSHFTTIETEIRDIAALRDACDELGLALLQDAEARGYGSARQRAEYVIRLNGPYDVALTRSNQGSYAVTADQWDGHVEREVGPGCGRLIQLYAVHKATREAHRRGFSVLRRQRQDGTIQLTIGGM